MKDILKNKNKKIELIRKMWGGSYMEPAYNGDINDDRVIEQNQLIHDKITNELESNNSKLEEYNQSQYESKESRVLTGGGSDVGKLSQIKKQTPHTKILNPITKKLVDLKSKEGKQILLNYFKYL